MRGLRSRSLRRLRNRWDAPSPDGGAASAGAAPSRRAWVNTLVAYGYLVIGAMITALGVNGVLLANRLAEGGITGLSLLLHYITGVGAGPLYFVLNAPVIAFGWRFVGRRFILRTLLGVVVLSLFLYLTRRFRYPLDDLMLASLYAGGVIGLGLGLMFRSGGSSGGMDVVAQYLRQRHGISIASTFLLTDVVILGGIWLALGSQTALYSLIVTFIGGRVIDYVQEGPRRAKIAYVLTAQPDRVREMILTDLQRGVTVIPGRGGYSGTPREVLLVVLRRGELGRLKSSIAAIDPEAFVIIGEVAEVLGEGFEVIE